jgi:HD-GYP domain-containing protein (c-di-GMP phosphodiesterase class II)
LFAIVDVWDALSFKRVYKDAWPQDEVLGYLSAQSGRQFDPTLVRLFVDNIERIRAAGEAAEELASQDLPDVDAVGSLALPLPAQQPAEERRL